MCQPRLIFLVVNVVTVLCCILADKIETDYVGLADDIPKKEGGYLQEKPIIQTKDDNEDTTRLPKLTPYEQYKDLFHLSYSNFTQEVLNKKDSWIVVFHQNGTISSGWKTMAASLRGIVWIGVVNYLEEADLLSFLELDNNNVPPAMVYPYGSKKMKQTHADVAHSPLEAKNKAVRSIPDQYQKLKGEDIESYLMDSFSTSPSRFPVLLMHSDTTPPPVFKALAIRFQKYFNFGIMTNPSPTDMSILGLQEFYFEYPAFLTMVTTNPIEPKMNAIIYNIEEMGEINYPNLMRYLFYVNGEYRYLLPGDSRSNEEATAKMSDIKEIEEERFDFVDDRDGSNKSANKDKKKDQNTTHKQEREGIKKGGKTEL